MTTFQDGPAQGQTLMLKRTPRFLRVVRSGDKWDALDQLGDTPRPEESIYAYEITEHGGAVHINRAGGRGGFYPMAKYQFVQDQPGETFLRSTEKWKSWCLLRAGQ